MDTATQLFEAIESWQKSLTWQRGLLIHLAKIDDNHEITEFFNDLGLDARDFQDLEKDTNLDFHRPTEELIAEYEKVSESRKNVDWNIRKLIPANPTNYSTLKIFVDNPELFDVYKDFVNKPDLNKKLTERYTSIRLFHDALELWLEDSSSEELSRAAFALIEVGNEDNEESAVLNILWSKKIQNQEHGVRIDYANIIKKLLSGEHLDDLENRIMFTDTLRELEEIAGEKSETAEPDPRNQRPVEPARRKPRSRQSVDSANRQPRSHRRANQGPPGTPSQ